MAATANPPKIVYICTPSEARRSKAEDPRRLCTRSDVHPDAYAAVSPALNSCRPLNAVSGQICIILARLVKPNGEYCVTAYVFLVVLRLHSTYSPTCTFAIGVRVRVRVVRRGVLVLALLRGRLPLAVGLSGVRLQYTLLCRRLLYPRCLRPGPRGLGGLGRRLRCGHIRLTLDVLRLRASSRSRTSKVGDGST
jgi:hypothetical protein